MDTVSLENEYLNIRINLNGAELSSVKNVTDDIEYIWQADKEVWGRHAPILFPIVGKLNDDKYIYNDNEFKMTQHGFARDMKFEIAEKSGNFVSLVLRNTEETMNKYPFEFEFYVNYTLEERSVLVNYQAINPSDESLYFSVGAHPGFNLPIIGQTQYTDYYFELSPNENRYQIPLENASSNPEKHFINKNNKLPITHELFKDDALIFELEGSNTISIKSDKTTYGVDLSTDNAEFVGLWSPYPIEGNFVCIEPWWGIADTVNTSGKFEEKFAIKCLKNKNDEFNANYTMIFNK